MSLASVRPVRPVAPLPLDPHLRRLAVAGVRWVDEPAPTGAAPQEEPDADAVGGADAEGDESAPQGQEAPSLTEDADRQDETAPAGAADDAASDEGDDDLAAQVETITRERDQARAERDQARAATAKDSAAVALRAVVSVLMPTVGADELDEIVHETNLDALVGDDGIDGERLLRRAQRAAGNTTRASGADPGQGTGGGAPPRSGLQAGREAYLATRK